MKHVRRALIVAGLVQLAMTARVLGIALAFRWLPAELRDGAAAAASVNAAVAEERAKRLAEAQRQYQAALEYVRTVAVFEQEDMDQLAEAKDALEVAWLEQTFGDGKPL